MQDATKATILALDPANTTGYAISDGTRSAYGTWDLTKWGTGHPGNRLVRLHELLVKTIRDNAVTLIAFEAASFGGINQATKAAHNELRGVIRMTAAEAGIPCREYQPTTIKKFATGHGHASKEQMIRAARTMLGLVTESDDVADAAWILALAQDDVKRPYVGKQKPQRRTARPRKKAEKRLF